MKNLILLLAGLVAGIILYHKMYSAGSSNDTSQNTEVFDVKGKVESNLSIFDQTVYKLVATEDESQSYWVIAKGDVPPIGEVLDVSLTRYDLVVINDKRVTVYIEKPQKSWFGF